MALDTEFQYYLEHQMELAKKHEGKYIVIKDQRVLGAYDDEIEAVKATSQNHEISSAALLGRSKEHRANVSFKGALCLR